MGGEEGDEEFTEEELAALRARLGTDRNIAIQYADWMGSMLFLDFGESYHYRNPVSEDLAQRIPITLQLTIMSLFISGIVAIPLGVFSAVRQDTWGDYISRAITVIGLATPNFFVGIMTIFLLILLFGWIPPIGYVNVWEEPWANMQQLFFPALALGTSGMAFLARVTRSALGTSGMAFLARVTRSAMLEVLNEDYIRTARSKGLGEKIVIYPRPKKCRAAGHHHLRVGVGKRGVRVGGNRDRLFGARHGAAIDRRGPAPGLSDDSGHNRGIRHNGLVSQPINRPDIRLAESPDSLRLIQRRTRGEE